MPICYPGVKAGLSNQKIALIGLIHKALRDNKPLLLPQIVSFDAQENNHEFCDFDMVYERSSLEKVLRAFSIPYDNAAFNAPHEEVDGSQCFWEGADRWGEAGRAGLAALPDLTCQIIRHLEPASLLRDFSSSLFHQLQSRQINCAIQMRIENDWQGYSSEVLPTFAEKDEDYCPNFLEIMQKCVNTLGKDIKKAYVLCDEKYLSVSKTLIREHTYKTFGIELFWKSDFLSEDLLKSSLISSMLDFEIAMQLPIFVGNSRSTFSCFISFEKTCRTQALPNAHYIYNLPGNYLGKRHDNGAMMVPQQTVDSLYGRRPMITSAPSDLPWPLSLTAHVSTVGDFISQNAVVSGVVFGDLVIDASQPVSRGIEGFCLDADSPLPAIEYKAIDRLGQETDWIPADQFCGTRGRNLPLKAFAVRLRGPASLSVDCLYAARFEGHSESVSARNGAWCRSDDDATLVAMQILFRRKTGV